MERFVVRLAKTGEDDPRAEVVGWYVSTGDRVEKRQPLVELRTGRTTRAVPAPAAGRVVAIRGDAGDTLTAGSELAVIEIEREPGPSDRPAILVRPSGVGEIAGAKPPPISFEDQLASIPLGSPPPRLEPMAPAAALGPEPEAAPALAGAGTPAEPAVGRPDGEIAAAPLAEAAGRGAGGPSGAAAGPPSWDVLEASLQQGIAEAIESLALPDPDEPSADDPSLPTVPPTPPAILPVAAPPVAVPVAAPAFAHLDEADVTGLEELIAHLNAKYPTRPPLTVLAFLVLALAKAVSRRPALADPSSDGSGHRLGIGDGLGLASVAVDADTLDPWAAAGALSRIAGVRGDDPMPRVGVLSLGEAAGLAAIPGLVPPAVAAIGLGRVAERPVVRGGGVVVRRTVTLGGSFDGRALAPREAAAMVQDLREALEHPAALFFE